MALRRRMHRDDPIRLLSYVLKGYALVSSLFFPSRLLSLCFALRSSSRGVARAVEPLIADSAAE